MSPPDGNNHTPLAGKAPLGRFSLKRLALRLGLFAVAAFAVLSLFVVFCPQARGQVSEYQLKAAFLASFPEFVTWPGSAFSGAGAPLVIGVLGDDPFGGVLDKAVQGKGSGGRKITVRRAQRVEDLQNCHLIFISRSERGQLAEILASLGSAPVLTVSDIEQFTRKGGAIGLIMSGPNVRLEINNSAAKRAGLSISSRLQVLAH